MLNSFNRNIKNILLVLLLIFFATVCFQRNFLQFANQDGFSVSKNESEALVLAAVVADDFGLDKKGGHLGFIAKEGAFKYPDNALDSYAIFSGEIKNIKSDFVPYTSQYGVQGKFFSKIHVLFGLNKLSQLQTINSFFLALIVVSLFLLYRHIYDNLFAIIFLVTLISSPWIISFARNLYWVPFLWFLPALFAAMLYLERRLIFRLILLMGIVVAVFIKSLAGYEYLSSITLFACSVFMVAPFFRDAHRNFSENLKLFIFVFTACVIGFVIALLVHADMRGDSILSGIQNIYQQDIQRRTYGNSSNFDPTYRASLESSAIDIVSNYIVQWKTDLIFWLPGSLFKFFLAFGVAGVVYKFSIKHVTRQRDAVLLAFFFIVPVSWFVLAKAHSYIHTQLNYVLWYFGFVQALLYVAVTSVAVFSLDFFKWIKTATTKDC